MTNNTTILPDSVAIYRHVKAFDLAIGDWIDELPIEKLMLYLVDTVDAKALPVLAMQFDVLGYKGWALCNTEADRRALIKRAIELHRYKGTKWAVRESLRRIGFDQVDIVEHTSGHWARFTVYLNNQNVPISSSAFANVVAMIQEYKPVRSVLDAIIMTLLATDTMTIEDTTCEVLESAIATDNVIFNGALFHDGTAQHDGSWDRSADADVALII